MASPSSSGGTATAKETAKYHRVEFDSDLEFDLLDFVEETDSDTQFDFLVYGVPGQAVIQPLPEFRKPQLPEFRKPQPPESDKPQLEDSGSSNIHVIVDQLKDLDVTLKEIGNLIFDLRFQKLKSIDTALSPRAKTIGFVEAIERANQLFNFMHYLRKKKGVMKHDSDTLQVFKRLVKQERVQDSYDKLDFQDIMDAINEHQMLLMLGNHFRLIKKHNGLTPLEVLALERTLRETIENRLENFGTQRENPIIDLVYRIRYKAYVMHEDPLVELERTVECHPGYCINNFRARLLQKYSEKKVRIQNIPIEYDMDKVKALLSSCGNIEDIELIECDGWFNDAYVTFSSAEEAKLAPFLCDFNFHISPYPEYPVHQSESSKTFIKKFKKAKSTYKKFRNLSINTANHLHS